MSPLSLAPFILFFLLFANGDSPDIVLGGIFSERCFPASNVANGGGGKSPCGELNPTRAVYKLAMKFAVSEINKRNDILPGIVLGTIFKETCCDQDYAVNETLNFDFVKRRFSKRTDECGSRDLQCCSNETQIDKPVAAIIIDANSHIVKAIVNLIGLFKVREMIVRKIIFSFLV